MPSDGTIDVRLEGDTSDFDEKMERSGRKIKDSLKGGHESLGDMMGRLDGMATKALSVAGAIALIGEAAKIATQLQKEVAEHGAAAGAMYTSIDAATRDLGGNKEGYQEWATRSNVATGITPANKTAFLGAMAGASRERSAKGLMPFGEDRIKEAMDLYDRGGNEGGGANGSDIVDSMSDMRFGTTTTALRWRYKAVNNGEFPAHMSAGDIVDARRNASYGKARRETQARAGISSVGTGADAGNFDDGLHQRIIDAGYNADTAPGGRFGDFFSRASTMVNPFAEFERKTLMGSVYVQEYQKNMAENLKNISDKADKQAKGRPSTGRHGDP